MNAPLTSGPVMVGDLRFGHLRHDPEHGWRFNPASSGRVPSRKWHATAEAALPRWVHVAIRKAAAKAAVNVLDRHIVTP